MGKSEKAKSSDVVREHESRTGEGNWKIQTQRRSTRRAPAVIVFSSATAEGVKGALADSAALAVFQLLHTFLFGSSSYKARKDLPSCAQSLDGMNRLDFSRGNPFLSFLRDGV